jgi:hypothetical protein
MGGESDEAPQSAVHTYDPARRVWGSAPALLQARTGLAAGVIGAAAGAQQQLMVCGGTSDAASAAPLNTCEVMSAGGGKGWTAAPALNVARNDHAAGMCVCGLQGSRGERQTSSRVAHARVVWCCVVPCFSVIRRSAVCVR